MEWCGGGEGLVCRGNRIVLSDHGSAILLAKLSHVGQFGIGQALIPVGEIVHRIVEPFLLMIGGGVENPAAEDVTEEFVSGLLESIWGRLSVSCGFLTCHAFQILLGVFDAANKYRGGQPGFQGRAVGSDPGVRVTDTTRLHCLERTNLKMTGQAVSRL